MSDCCCATPTAPLLTLVHESKEAGQRRYNFRLMAKSYRLFADFAARYDLHTPPHHDRPDHDLVLDELRRFGPGARVLDLGCGTGAFLQHARAAGLDAFGIDASPEMAAIAEQRLGPGIVRVQRLQDVEEVEAYDALLALS